jgi:hypothetical protein
MFSFSSFCYFHDCSGDVKFSLTRTVGLLHIWRRQVKHVKYACSPMIQTIISTQPLKGSLDLGGSYLFDESWLGWLDV